MAALLMKKLYQALIAGAMVCALSGPAVANDYYLAIGMKAKAGTVTPGGGTGNPGDPSAPTSPYSIYFNDTTVPDASINQTYDFDLSTMVSVYGDAAFDPSKLIFSTSYGALPTGLSLTTAGQLSGTPVISGSTSFQVNALYKDTGAQQSFTIYVNGYPLAITSLSVADDFACALTTAGGVKCWGSNQEGNLGAGISPEAMFNSAKPLDVVGLTSGVAQVAVGRFGACAVTQAGALKCWGSNYNGLLGVGLTTDDLMRSDTPMAVQGLSTGVAEVTIGTFHACARLTNGAVKCWGDSSGGQSGDGGTGIRYSPSTVSISGATSIAAGGYHTCAITSSGLKCWGDNSQGELGDGTLTDRLSPVSVVGLVGTPKVVAAGGASTCAVNEQGGAMCWGINNFGQLGNGNLTSSKTPVSTYYTSGVRGIALSGQHACVTLTTGELRCWGGDYAGVLGNGISDFNSYFEPVVPIGLGSNVRSVSVGGYNTCVALTDNTARCVGSGGLGQLGNGKYQDTTSFVTVQQ